MTFPCFKRYFFTFIFSFRTQFFDYVECLHTKVLGNICCDCAIEIEITDHVASSLPIIHSVVKLDRSHPNYFIEKKEEGMRSFDEIMEDWSETSGNDRDVNMNVPDVQTIDFEAQDVDESLGNILKLPSTPKREGKKNVKRTHPFASQNINDLKDKRMKKEQIEEEKRLRKIIRDEKSRTNALKKLEAAVKRQEKDKRMIEKLTQQLN